MYKMVYTFLGVILLLFAAVIFSMTMGSIKVGFIEIIHGLFSGNNEEVEVIRDLRLPRILVSLLTGACLAVSGVLLQAVMRNPLADAGVIGVSAGAGVVSLLMVTLFPALFFWMPLFSFFGGALACFMVYALLGKQGLVQCA